MNMPIHKINSKKRLAHQMGSEERELWLKLVVKVIRWKDDPLKSENFNPLNKITSKEWNFYHKNILKNNINGNRQKILSTLNETKVLIKNHGGFELSD